MTSLAEAEPPATDAVEGAGVVSSWADLIAALSAERVDADRVCFAAAGAGLDTLGAALYPFNALLRAGLGWLFEHIAFLREPLDVLAGDPDAVLAQARHWDQVAAELRYAATDYRAGTAPDWHGLAADGHRQAVDELGAALSSGADQADALGRLILLTGAAVGTTRAWVRDTITDFVAMVVQYLLAAGTLAFLSAGGSLAGVVVAVVVRALEVAENIARRLRQLLEALAAAEGLAGRIGTAVRGIARRIEAARPAAQAAGRELSEAADRARAPLLIDSGKQLTDAIADHHRRPEPPG
ncbi:MAG TPA: hypothetical protein VNA11_16245 [Pseudonocardia sp.]|nr:hypothetical protein [Pseudonocardia sp.]